MSSFIGPGMPDMRAQKLLRRPAAVGLFAACFADTGGLRLPPSLPVVGVTTLLVEPAFGVLPLLAGPNSAAFGDEDRASAFAELVVVYHVAIPTRFQVSVAMQT